jgi:hypothetical protein
MSDSRVGPTVGSSGAIRGVGSRCLVRRNFFNWVAALAMGLASTATLSFGQCQSSGNTCNINSDCCAGMCAQPAPGCHTELCPTAQCLGNSGIVNIKTVDGHFLTAVDGGGVGGPDSGPQSAAIHTDATSRGSWETFTCAISLPSTITFKTNDGHFVTAVNGGNIGGPNANPFQLHTDATAAGQWEQFTFVNISNTSCALKTSDGHFVSAVNRGGWGDSDGANKFPIHTNSKTAGQWETFTIVTH